MVQFPNNIPSSPTVGPADAPALRFAKPEHNQAADTTAFVQPTHFPTDDSTTLAYGQVARAASEPNQFRFPEFLGGKATTDAVNTFLSMGTPVGNDYTDQIMSHPGNKASRAEAQQISEAVNEAAERFNVDPRVLLATLAHESQFDVDANNGNGKGLGQLTGPAVGELERISNGGRNGHRARVTDDTYDRLRTPESRDLFDRLKASPRARLNLRDNVMVSAAYLRLMLDTNRNDTRQALSDYNGSGGAVQRAYPGKVADAYADLFDTNMPSEIVS